MSYDKEREEIRKELECIVYPLGHLVTYKYVVVCSFYQGKYVLSKHKIRDTWETQGGHIEVNETPIEAAKRELLEESGVSDAEIYPVCDYYGYNHERHSNGQVFVAIVHSFNSLPDFEMKEIKIFDELPTNLTYPKVTPVLFQQAQRYLKNNYSK